MLNNIVITKVYRKYLEDQARQIWKTELPWWEKDCSDEEFEQQTEKASNEDLIKFIKEWSIA